MHVHVHAHVVVQVLITPFRFEWKLSNADRKVLSVHPKSGTIYPNETQVNNTTFNYTVYPYIHTHSSILSLTLSFRGIVGVSLPLRPGTTPSKPHYTPLSLVVVAGLPLCSKFVDVALRDKYRFI